ncbi:MAG: hypothetical protein HRT77_15275 [Halioglobus sp.]|nr:hypothetical protein [Halioglobus sp.]
MSCWCLMAGGHWLPVFPERRSGVLQTTSRAAGVVSSLRKATMLTAHFEDKRYTFD